jgi:hypothetical protein
LDLIHAQFTKFVAEQTERLKLDKKYNRENFSEKILNHD